MPVSIHCRLCLITFRLKVLQNGRFVMFSKRADCWCALSWIICNQNGLFIKCIQRSGFQVMTAHTNHGKASSAKRNGGRNPKLIEWDRRTWKRITSKNHSTAARVTAELNIHRADPVPPPSKKIFTSPTFTVEMPLLNFWLLKTTIKCEKYGVMIIKHKRLMIGNTSHNQMSYPSCCSEQQARFMSTERPRKPTILTAGFQLWNMQADLWWFGQQETMLPVTKHVVWHVYVLRPYDVMFY
jgi:hypothetical protein